MKSDRDIEKMVSRMGLKRSEKQAVIHYSKGLKDGMRMAYLAVARRMLAGGQDSAAVRSFLAPLMKKNELNDLMAEAESAAEEGVGR